jgi:hypothetical protein
MRKQKAVYWAVRGVNGQGRVTLDRPVQIDCRWDGMQGTFTNKDGVAVTSSGTVYPDRELTLRGYLFQGLLVNAPADPNASSTCFEIGGFRSTPNLKARETLYTAYLNERQ